MGPNCHHRQQWRRGRKFSTPVGLGTAPQILRHRAADPRVARGANFAPPSLQVAGAIRLVARWGKFSPAVTSRPGANGVAESATPLTAHNARKPRSHGSGKLPPPCPTPRPTTPLATWCRRIGGTRRDRPKGDGGANFSRPSPATSRVRQRPRAVCRGAFRMLMVAACSRVVTGGSHQVGAHRFPQRCSGARRGGTGPV